MSAGERPSELNVTRTTLPAFDDYVSLLRDIWKTSHISNHGPLVTRLEDALSEYLGVRNVIATCNGTVALQVAIRAARLAGSVVTTPFSYVATCSSLLWEGCEPVFGDIDRDSLCISPTSAEGAMREGTTGILATHVYGNVCDVDGLAALAKRKGIKLIYDAAHTFGARLNGRSLCSFGDVSTLSFHATKLFHTGEGGAVVTDDDDIAARARWLRNFGHDGQEHFVGVGINGKMSELSAAMGLALWPRIDELIEHRRQACALYDADLAGAPLTRPVYVASLSRNYAYYPVMFADEQTLLKVRAALETENIRARRYFYPSLNKLPFVAESSMPASEDAARRVLCLPLSSEIAGSDIARVAAVVRAALQLPARVGADCRDHLERAIT